MHVPGRIPLAIALRRSRRRTPTSPAPAPDPLVEAVHDHRLAAVAERIAADPAASPDDRARARRSIDACDRIAATLERRAAELRSRLDEAAVPIDGIEPIDRRQNHTITFLVADAGVAARAVEAIVPLGFEPWETWTGGALESFRRSADQMTAGRTTDVTLVVRFRWSPRMRRSLLDRALTPTAGDWDLVTLPTWAWRVYPIVRLLRLTFERAGLRARHSVSLGPFVSTPLDLIEPLVHDIGLDHSDVAVDLGCGDGRVVVAIAELAGCRARGVEHDAELVAHARRRAVEAGVADRVEVVLGDARSAELADASVVFVFLPPEVLNDLLPDLIARMPTGSQLIAHEQTRLPAATRPEPTTSHLVVGDESITVAHRWIA